MTDKPKIFQQKYGFTVLEVGDVAAIRVASKREELNARKAAHNVNRRRSDKYLSTRLVNGVLYVTRIR